MAKLKLNLQMFAYDPNSIVDYLKSTGKDSSYSARKELAQSMGISNYSGTAAQNTQMLNSLKSGSNNNKTSNSSSGNTSAPSKNATSVNVNSIPSLGETSSGGNAIGNEIASYVEKDRATSEETLTKKSSKKSGSSKSSGFAASSAYLDALEQTNALLEQLNNGKTTYADRIKQLIDDINNRDPFSYDLNTDPLFQQYLSSSMVSGQMAMQDTMGQAAALTGGYGSTYATSAANQQYNAYIQDAYDNLPAYYQLAMQAYEMQGDEMYKQLAVMTEADAAEFDRLYSSYNANASFAQQLYGNEYGEYIDELNLAWREKEFAESQKQYASDLELKYAQLAQDQAQFDASLAQDQAQFDAQMAMKARSGSGGGSGDKYRTMEAEEGFDPSEADYYDFVQYINHLKETGKIGDIEAYDIVMDWLKEGHFSEKDAFGILSATNTNWYADPIRNGVMS